MARSVRHRQRQRTKQSRFGIVSGMILQNFADAFERVKGLVSIFSQNEGRYLSTGYSEAQARLDFIDKFWIALGWDVGHENQTDPYKQEVKVEHGVATNEWRKRS
jgi:adenine-specific DNA-methyltransferase